MNNYGSILIVDDNPSILTALRYCLDTTFERIITLDKPDDILKTMAQETIDIVLLDMNFTLGVNSGQEGDRRDCSGCAPSESTIRRCPWCC